MIPDLDYLDDRDEVDVPCSSLARYGVARDGTVWVRKGYFTTHEFIAEASSWLLATELGIPVPKAAIWTGDPDGPIWCSRYVAETSSWDPDRVATLRNPQDVGRILALDAILSVTDRHQHNAIMETRGKDTWVWAVDYGTSCAYSHEQIMERLRGVYSPTVLLPGLSLSWLREGAIDIADRASMLPRATIADALDYAYGRLDDEVPEAHIDALACRFANAYGVVRHCLDWVDP